MKAKDTLEDLEKLGVKKATEVFEQVLLYMSCRPYSLQYLLEWQKGRENVATLEEKIRKAELRTLPKRVAELSALLHECNCFEKGVFPAHEVRRGDHRL